MDTTTDTLESRTMSVLDSLKSRTTEILETAEWLKNRAEFTQPELVKVISGCPLGDAFDAYKDFEDAVRSLEDSTKQLSALCTLAREVLMPERMDAENIPTVNTNRIRASRTSRIFASIRSDLKEMAYDWLRSKGYGSIIKEQVNASSLSALAKEIMATGHELPEDMFTVYMKDGVSITVKK